MANPLKNNRRPTQTDEEKCKAVANQVAQQALRVRSSTAQLLKVLDAAAARAPGGLDAILDCLATQGTAGDVIEQIQDIVERSTNLFNAHLDTGEDAKTLPITASAVAASKTRKGV